MSVCLAEADGCGGTPYSDSDPGARPMIEPLAAATLLVLLTGYQGVAQTIYPIDRAAILAGSRFDFKVEFPDRIDPSKLKVTVNGEDYRRRLRRARHVRRARRRQGAVGADRFAA